MQILSSLLQNYNKYEPPRRDGPTEVKVAIYINQLSVRGKEATITMYFRQSWNDPRLAFQQSASRPIRLFEWDKIWVPDTFFRNEVYSFVHDQTVPNRLVKLINNGDVWYVMKLTMKQMVQQTRNGELKLPIMIESFGYMMDTMYLSFLSHPLEIGVDVDTPVVGQNTFDCSMNYTAGSFTCLQFDLDLQRT